jgi:hypothetical protein
VAARLTIRAFVIFKPWIGESHGLTHHSIS